MRARWPFLIVTAIILGVAAVTLIMLRTMPPRSIVMVTGPDGGAYQEMARRYQAILARAGVRLRLVPSEGTLQNIALLRDSRSGVGIGFIHGGTTSETEAPEIESLGTVFYEPLWAFYRSELRAKGLNDLLGRKISIGPEGSGTRALSLELLK